MALRRTAVGFLLAGVLAGCSSAGSTPSTAPAPSHPDQAASPGHPNAGHPNAAPSARAATATASLPDGSHVLLPDHRIVAFYGEAGNATLGVLGSASPQRLWPRLSHQAAAYRHLGKPVLPAYELITYLATSGASELMPHKTIAAYASAVRRHHGLLILDIQPGHGRMLPDARRLRPWLLRPDVDLALDPEWELHGSQQAGKQIGHTSAAEVNAVSSWLDRLTASHRLPQKLLLVHQFTPDMVRDKATVDARRNVALVFNMDGFGSRPLKHSEYRSLARDRRFPLGMKLFYSSDPHIYTPRDAARLRPSPLVVDYE